MKNNQVLTVVTALFFVCSLVTIFNMWNYRSALNQLGQTEAKANYVRGTLTPTLQSLVYDTTEYSKKNPAVVPILQALSNSVMRASSPAAKPATK
jgi:hypothetical protein